MKATHRLVEKVTHDFERWSYNTAVAALREHTNVLYRYTQSAAGARRATLDESVDTMLLLLAPIAPHLSVELWERRHGEGTRVHAERWPVADPAMLTEERVTLVVQVNGKVRERIEISPAATTEECVAAALASPKVASQLQGREPQRVIARPPNLVNVVI